MVIMASLDGSTPVEVLLAAVHLERSEVTGQGGDTNEGVLMKYDELIREFLKVSAWSLFSLNMVLMC